MKEKITEFIKNKPLISWAIGTVSVALVIAVIVSSVFLAFSSSGDDDSGTVNSDIKWGEGITEKIPEFTPAPDSSFSIKQTETGVAAYYTEVKGEDVEKYTERIEKECGIKFSSDKYPRSAVYGDKIIVIHYNVTEMKMSVTVAEIGNNNNSQTTEE